MRTSIDVFAKARDHERFEILRAARELDMLPYFRVLEGPTLPKVEMEGRARIMLGSNNYLGLTGDERVKQGALGDNMPSRDLLMSPDHALLIDGALIQAGALVNDTSIVRETKVPERFTYYHVELADHSLILAENTPAETFIDNADRMAFDNWDEHDALPDAGDMQLVEMSYPRAKAYRQVPRATRDRLARRAEARNGLSQVA